MEVNPAQLLENGYIILPQVIPPEQLDHLRRGFETLVERQRIVRAEERTLRIHPVGFGKRARNRKFFFQ